MDSSVHAIRRSRMRISRGVVLAALLIGASCVLAAGNQLAYAATPPDSCFAFNAGTGTITDYYDHEGNNPANPACPRDVDIPETIGGLTVTAVGSNSFSYKQLTDVTIPTSVTSIGGGAFSGNKLKHITVPFNVTNIGGTAFVDNQIVTVVIENISATVEHSSFRGNPIASMTIGGNTYTEQSPTSSVECFSISGSRLNDYHQASALIARNHGVLCGREVAVPEGVVDVGSYAFQNNQLTSISFPDSVITIESYAFWQNKITNVTFGANLVTIGQHAFLANSIETVVVPTSLVNIGVGAFALQNKWGKDIESGANDAPYIFTNDPVEAQEAYDEIWYVRLYTEDPSNPNNLLSSASHEESWFGSCDCNDNGINDSIGGFIVNPASVSIKYLNSNKNSISVNQIFTGIDRGSYLADYFVSKGPLPPPPVNSYSPTADELAAISEALSVYYRLGQSIELTPPSIPGYITPPTQSFVLGAANNNLEFVYSSVDGPSVNEDDAHGHDDEELADTGASIYLVALGASLLIGGSIALAARSKS